MWWAVFTTIPLLKLRNRPPIAGARGSATSLTDGFRQLGHTLRDLKKYPLTLFFLVAYLVYNDGIQTVDHARRDRTAPRNWTCPTRCWCRRS